MAHGRVLPGSHGRKRFGEPRVWPRPDGAPWPLATNRASRCRPRWYGPADHPAPDRGRCSGRRAGQNGPDAAMVRSAVDGPRPSGHDRSTAHRRCRPESKGSVRYHAPAPRSRPSHRCKDRPRPTRGRGRIGGSDRSFTPRCRGRDTLAYGRPERRRARRRGGAAGGRRQRDCAGPEPVHPNPWTVRYGRIGVGAPARRGCGRQRESCVRAHAPQWRRGQGSSHVGTPPRGRRGRSCTRRRGADPTSHRRRGEHAAGGGRVATRSRRECGGAGQNRIHAATPRGTRRGEPGRAAGASRDRCRHPCPGRRREHAVGRSESARIRDKGDSRHSARNDAAKIPRRTPH